MPIRSALQAAALALVIGLPTVALAGPVDHAILVRAAFSETLALVGTPPCFAIGTLRGSGQAPSFGSFTVTSQDCVNPVGTFDPARPGSDSFAFGSTAAGLVLTSGTGDKLFVTYSGTVAPQTNGPHRLNGQFVVTGGTGAYFTATGGGILFGTEDINQTFAGQGEMTVVGIVKY